MMIKSEQSISCPECSTDIAFDPKQLLMGTQFECSNCGAKIGLAQESMSQAKSAFEDFEELKGSILNSGKGNDPSKG